MDPPARPKAGPLETGKDGAGARREVFALARRCANVLRMARYRQGGQGGHEDGFSRAAVNVSPARCRCPRWTSWTSTTCGRSLASSSGQDRRLRRALRMAPGLQVICVTRSGDQRGGGERRRREEEETSQLVASAAPRTRPFILSPLPLSFLPLPTHRPLQLLQPALRSATQRKRGRPKRSYSHEYE